MIKQYDIIRACEDRNMSCIYENLRKASKAQTLDEAIEIATTPEAPKPIDPDMAAYMAYNDAIRYAQKFASLAGEVGEGIGAEDIADAIDADIEKAHYDEEVRKFLAIAKENFKGARRWAEPEILSFPYDLER